MQRIGFVGASGLMGHGIAKNLRARGYPLALTVHRNRDRVADLLAAGATEVAAAAALASNVGPCEGIIMAAQTVAIRVMPTATPIAVSTPKPTRMPSKPRSGRSASPISWARSG